MLMCVERRYCYVYNFITGNTMFECEYNDVVLVVKLSTEDFRSTTNWAAHYTNDKLKEFAFVIHENGCGICRYSFLKLIS